MFKRLVGCLMVLVLVAVLTAACSGVTTIPLTDPVTRNASRGSNDEADWACFPIACTFSHGTGPLADPPAGRIRVGFDYTNEDGTSPCNCWYWVDHVYRGHIKFDTTQLTGKRIVSATLQWSESAIETVNGDIFRGEGTTCLGEVRAPNSPWSWDESYTDSWTPPGPINVTSVVQGWASSPSSNQGFYFVGSDERMPERTDHSCLGELSNFKLNVIVAR